MSQAEGGREETRLRFGKELLTGRRPAAAAGRLSSVHPRGEDWGGSCGRIRFEEDWTGSLIRCRFKIR